ncbi:MAG: TrkH family potassium uptake protein [Oscillospiraceae bacterium]|jgi:trk system potassium uptake protein TrkH|nr:TrkH family potassium uptake protein [Oscillospiraceae bacterium]
MNNRNFVFRTVTSVWLAICVLGALPYIFTGTLGITDALFESVSGFTTTGLTVVTRPESLPSWLLVFRSFTHWIGGMGVIALLLAILPRLGAGSAQLMSTESTGPVKGKTVAITRQAAKSLYAIYFVITALMFALLCVGVAGGGMTVTDALIHTFSTVGTGGFSSKGLSVTHYDSVYITTVITVFMMLCSVNFSLYYLILMRKLKSPGQSEELRWMLGIYVVAVAVITLVLRPYYGGASTALRQAAFQSASAMSTTGFFTADFGLWPTSAQVVLIGLMFIGGSAGSTAGGFKVSRALLLCKSARQELKKLLRPNAVSVTRLGGKAVSETAIQTAGSYLVFYVLIIAFGTLILSFDKYNFETVFLTTVSAVNNIGLSWGEIGTSGNLSGFGVLSKSVLMAVMLLGRLEIYPLLMAVYGIKRK